MKHRFLLVLCLFVTGSVLFCQNIGITLPQTPPANTAAWASGTPPFTITVSNTATLAESSILVYVRSTSGAVVCGANQPGAAQPTNIRPGTPKVWAGTNAVALLGNNCVLPTGSYELCVQIIPIKRQEAAQENLTRCLPFDIKELDCTPPSNINPAQQKNLGLVDISKPVAFNWSPMVISNRTAITYRLMIWEIEEGQTMYEALYNNYPIINKDIKGITQYIAPPGSFEKRSAQYVWRVMALGQDERPICRTAQSEPTIFTTSLPDPTIITEPQDSSVTKSDSCCTNKIEEKSKTVAVSPSNTASISQNFNITPVNIKYISAEIVSVKESVIDTACMKCASHEDWIYNFISQNTVSWNSGLAMNASPVNGSTYYPSKLIEWHCNQQGNLQFKFKIPLPENKSGCNRKSTICIRYKFIDINCITCEKVICYDITN